MTADVELDLAVCIHPPSCHPRGGGDPVIQAFQLYFACKI